MSCGNSRSSKCNPCGPSEDALNEIVNRAAYYARIAVEAANVAQLEDGGHARWGYIGDGIQTIFDIPGAGTTISASYIVGIDGVLQDPDNYTITYGDPYTLTMSVPVPAGSEIVIVSIKGITGATGPIGPSGGGATGATGPLPPSNFGNAWAYIGDGSQTVFAITGGLSTISLGYLVHIDGVYQKSTNYTINSITPRELTMSSPVPAGSEITIISISTL